MGFQHTSGFIAVLTAMLTVRTARTYAEFRSRPDIQDDMNLTELLDKAASQWPQKPALIEGDVVVTYAGLVQQVNEWAAKFEGLLPKGARVGLCYPNGVNYVALTFALWRINAVVVPIPMEARRKNCPPSRRRCSWKRCSVRSRTGRAARCRRSVFLPSSRRRRLRIITG